ncbi:MAG: hypothetical protein R3242_10730 [Akkermansiaceae bacterium]|nr:hypothetical protein [Akkermansiaceae bacterium]
MKAHAVLLAAMLTHAFAFAQTGADVERVPLEGRWHDAYFANPPQGLLLDPQRLLRGSEARDAREFLDYYASDSKINLRVLLFKGDQELVRSSTETALHGHWPSPDKPEVVLYYYMGTPERAELHLSEALDAVVPRIEQQRALVSCIEFTESAVTAPEALEKFMVQLSIRMDRMVRLLEAGAASPAPLVMKEPGEGDPIVTQGNEPLQKVKAFWWRWGFMLIGALVAIALFIVACAIHRRRATYRFPDHDVRERLGGAHGAGVGAVIYFSSRSEPPAAQLEQLKRH